MTDPVTHSLELVAEKVGDPAPAVYARLFAELPEMEPLFVRDTTGAVKGEMLAVALQCLLDLVGSGQYAPYLIATERVNHDGWDVPQAAFARFFPLVMETFRGILGPEWTPEIQQAWDEVLARIDALVALPA